MPCHIQPSSYRALIYPLDNSVDPDQMAHMVFHSVCKYSKTCVKQPLKNRHNRDLNDKCQSIWIYTVFIIGYVLD